MTPASMYGYCLVCQDAKRFNISVSEILNIKNRTEQLLTRRGYKINESEFKLWLFENSKSLPLIQTDKKHIHFMCGVCHKVNTNELVQAESALRHVLEKICYLIATKQKEEIKSLYTETLHNLRGYYPVTYKTIERFFFKTHN